MDSNTSTNLTAQAILRIFQKQNAAIHDEQQPKLEEILADKLHELNQNLKNISDALCNLCEYCINTKKCDN